MLLFALFASIVFGITQRETPRRMFRYGVYCFALFVRFGDRAELGDVFHRAVSQLALPPQKRRSFDSPLVRRGGLGVAPSKT